MTVQQQVRPIQVRRLGHVVLKVRSLERAERFYCDVLGFKVSARYHADVEVAFLTIDDYHHDLALVDVGENAPAAAPEGTGLAHYALKIGDSDDDLRNAVAWLEANGCELGGMSDHRATHSLYVRDPDGHEIELYADRPREEWADVPDHIAAVWRLRLYEPGQAPASVARLIAMEEAQG
jgi:catechol 2,3-dioxygenase